MSFIDVKLDDPRLRPVRAHPTDAGADLRTAEAIELEPGEMRLVDTGAAVKIPPGYVGLLFNRSSQGKLEVQLPNAVGVIDSDYRGNIKVLLKNNGFSIYKIEPFTTKIAQLVIVPCALVSFKDFSGSWDDTVRGTGGFGSTGV